MKRLFLIIFLGTVSFSNLLAHGMSEEDKIRMMAGGYLEYIKLGTTHMLSGYDHLLFLFGVIFFLTNFKDILKFITAFTLGHCITLVFATFMQITANEFLVDAVIAITVMYKGFDNIDGFKKYFNCKAPNVVALVFVFGLIHGFGLSTRLQQLPLLEGEGSLLGKILCFNVGVELGQVIALTIMLVVLKLWRSKSESSFERFSFASNFGLILVGGLLLLMQLHRYEHQSNTHDYAGFLAAESAKHEVSPDYVNSTSFTEESLAKMGVKIEAIEESNFKTPDGELNDVLVLPKAAVIEYQGNRYILVHENEYVLRRKVKVVFEDDTTAIIAPGTDGTDLLAAEIMVIQGATKLNESLIEMEKRKVTK